ncbi:Cation diffusion facilitator, partial [Globisporangium splendens]
MNQRSSLRHSLESSASAHAVIAISGADAAASEHRSSSAIDDNMMKLSRSPFASCMQVLRGEKAIDHVAMVLQTSLTTNIIIVLVMTSVAIASHSLALLSALVENMVDLLVQGLLWYAGTRSGKKQDYAKYPAGTSRFEPVAIIVAASIMVLVSVVFIQEGVTKLVDGFAHGQPEAPKLSAAAVVIVTLAVLVKIGLIFYSRWVLKFTYSASVEAIQDDNRNDTISNAFAIIAYIIASVDEDLWYVDPAGAILIFLFIMFAWAKMGKEQVAQLVGVCASEEFMTEVKELCGSHHPSMSLDIMRAYHFGSKYLVELEVVVPADMTVKMAHDIALQLQFKVENLEDVERAFVHVDYKTRDYDEHVVSREEDALLVYAGYEAQPVKSGDSYLAVPVSDVTAVPPSTPNTPTDAPNTDFYEFKG